MSTRENEREKGTSEQARPPPKERHGHSMGWRLTEEKVYLDLSIFISK